MVFIYQLVFFLIKITIFIVATSLFYRLYLLIDWTVFKYFDVFCNDYHLLFLLFSNGKERKDHRNEWKLCIFLRKMFLERSYQCWFSRKYNCFRAQNRIDCCFCFLIRNWNWECFKQQAYYDLWVRLWANRLIRGHTMIFYLFFESGQL